MAVYTRLQNEAKGYYCGPHDGLASTRSVISGYERLNKLLDRNTTFEGT